MGDPWASITNSWAIHAGPKGGPHGQSISQCSKIMEDPRVIHWQPIGQYRKLMVSPWVARGSTTDQPWIAHERTMGQPWVNHGTLLSNKSLMGRE